MTTILWITGATVLFLGRELNFLFSAIMAGFLASRFTYILPYTIPYWGDYVFIVLIGLLSGWATTANKDTGYYVTGALAGGFVASQVFAPGAAGLPLLPFLLGAIAVAVLTGLLKEWGLIIVSCLVGIYMIYQVMPLVGTAKTLASTGLFILAALAQVVLLQMQKNSD